MEKRITNKTHHTAVRSKTKRVALAAGPTISIFAGISIVIFGYTHIALFILLSSLIFSVAHYIYHHISSGAYLPQTQEKLLRQKLIRLKFKLSEEYSQIIESSIKAESKILNDRKLLENVLQKFFSPREITYQRYFQVGNSALNAIDTYLESIVNKLTTLKQFENEQNKLQIVHQIEENLKEIHQLFEAFEGLIMSFEACELQPNKTDIFDQLEQLAKRTEKYIHL